MPGPGRPSPAAAASVTGLPGSQVWPPGRRGPPGGALPLREHAEAERPFPRALALALARSPLRAPRASEASCGSWEPTQACLSPSPRPRPPASTRGPRCWGRAEGGRESFPSNEAHTTSGANFRRGLSGESQATNVSRDRRTRPRRGGGSRTCRGPRGARARLAGPRGGLQPLAAAPGRPGALTPPSARLPRWHPSPSNANRARQSPRTAGSRGSPGGPLGGGAGRGGGEAAGPSGRAAGGPAPTLRPTRPCGPDGERRPGEAGARPERAARPGGRGVGGPTPRGREGARGGRPRSCLRRRRELCAPGSQVQGLGEGARPECRKPRDTTRR